MKFYDFEGATNMVICANSLESAILCYLEELDVEELEEIDQGFNMSVRVMEEKELDNRLRVVDGNDEEIYDEHGNQVYTTYREAGEEVRHVLPEVISRDF